MPSFPLPPLESIYQSEFSEMVSVSSYHCSTSIGRFQFHFHHNFNLVLNPDQMSFTVSNMKIIVKYNTCIVVCIGTLLMSV